ncbi:MAG: ATPase, T2SS/T4P/T4SS family [Candidatus Gracilibacteria bacterium]
MAEPNPKLQQLQEAILSGNIPQMVLSTISYALDLRSSDIHIEPEENTVRIRYRVDGVLRQIVEYPHNIHPAVVSRIKIMSNLKIDEQRMPQDGRSTVSTKDGREMDLRISTLPTVKGEKVVMRIQDKSRKIPDLPELGLQGNALRFFEEALGLPNGIILTTGPTGSGKTTTMYSALTRLNEVEVNIMTIEDPVEIQLDGLNQSQVHPDIDYTFANGLRTALRQDPDIIMVGEIRDRETIDIAIESALTGHLVLSTIHTNSAVETLTRILNMGVPGFLMASTVELIIAQRLVRKLCDNCKKPVEKVDDELLEIVKKAISEIHSTDEIDPAMLQTLQFYDAPGCEVCEGIGYKGRIGLYEVMRMNNELRRMILSSASTLDIEKKAMEGGMVTLEQMGIIKALKGETSLNEVYRVAKRMELGDDSKKNEKADEQKPIPDENPEAEKSAPSKKVVAQVQQVTPPAEQPKPASPSIPTPAPAPEENSPQTPPSDTQQQ